MAQRMKSCSSDIDRAVRGLLSWDVPTAQGENPNVGDARAAAEIMAIADFMIVQVGVGEKRVIK